MSEGVLYGGGRDGEACFWAGPALLALACAVLSRGATAAGVLIGCVRLRVCCVLPWAHVVAGWATVAASLAKRECRGRRN